MPQAQTVERPPRLPLVIAPANRDDTTSKDAKLVNCYVESSGEGESKEYHLFKRPGLLTNTTLSGAGQGMYNWKGNIYSVFGTLLYKDGVSVGTVDATNGVYRFSSCLGATPKLVLGNGVKAYTYDSGAGLVEITDVDFVKPYVKGWSYLDGTTYYMDSSAAIRGTAINDPQTLDPLNKVIAQIEPDGGVALAKQLVYVIALKQWTTEVFHDAANPTGSPLGRVEGAKINYGCISADSVQDVDGTLIWLATTRSGSAQVVMLENLKAQPVSTKPVERLLDDADFTTVFSWQFNHDGHKFYGLTSKVANLTLVFDISEGVWHQWTDSNGNYFPIVSATYSPTLQHLLQHESNGKIYAADTSYTTDDGAVITADIYTPNFDGGVRRRKHMKFMEFIADQTTGSTLLVRKSDDDYQTWSNFRTVDLSKKRPFLTDCGTFYKRAHHFRHQSPTRMRIQAVEMQIDLGVL